MGSASVEQLEKSQDSWLGDLIEKIGLKRGNSEIKYLPVKPVEWFGI